MSQPIPPEDLQLLIAGYVLHDLSEEEAAIVEQLLDSPEMVQSIEQMQQTLEQVYAPPAVSPPAHLRQAVMAAFSAETTAVQGSSQPVAVTSPTRIRSLPGWVKGLGAVAAMLIVALSTSNYLLWRSLQALQSQQKPLVISLYSTATFEEPAYVEVNIHPDTLQGTLKVENLPPLEAGKVYVLWTVLTPNAPFTTDAKNAILTQVFTVEAEGDLTQSIIMPKAFQDPTQVQAIAITVEDAAAPQKHQSKPILIQKL